MNKLPRKVVLDDSIYQIATTLNEVIDILAVLKLGEQVEEYNSIIDGAKKEKTYTIAELRVLVRECHKKYPTGSGAYFLPELGFLDWLEEQEKGEK